MTKRFRKVLSIVCALALLVSCAAAGFAEETPEEMNGVPEANGADPVTGDSGDVAEEETGKILGMVVEDVELPETIPEEEPAEPEQQEEEKTEEPASVPMEPENEEVISEPVTIQEAVEEAAEEKRDEQPAAEEKPAEPAPAAPEEKEEEQQEPAEENKEEEPADQPEEKPENKPEEKPEEPEEEAKEAVYMDLDVKKDVSGILTRGKPFALIAADAYSRTIIFTLTVSEEDAVSVTLNDKPVTLEKQENPDPLSTDVIYTFEKQLLQNQVYSISLATEREGYIPFTLKIEEKKETAAEKPQETSEETTEETDSGLNEQEQSAEEDDKIQQVQKSVSFEITYDNDTSVFGEFAHFKACLVGFEDVEYIITWQSSIDGINWNDTDQHDEQMDVEITEENCHLSWRLKVNTLD